MWGVLLLILSLSVASADCGDIVARTLDHNIKFSDPNISRLKQLMTLYRDLSLSNVDNNKVTISGETDDHTWIAFLYDYFFYRFNPFISEDNTCASFCNFRRGETDSPQDKGWRLSRALVDKTFSTSRGLFFYGAAGTGKSHLAIAAAREIFAKLPLDNLVVAEEKMTYLRWKSDVVNFMHRGNEVYITQKLKNSEIIVIDDLNELNFSEQREFFKILISFIHDNGGKKIIITSNLTPEQIFSRLFALEPAQRERYETRFFARFLPIEFSGPQQRPVVTTNDFLDD